MIGIQIELKLAHLLKTVSDSEKEVEVVRQVLAEQQDFEPYTAFKRVDSLGLGYIRVSDLHEFLRENGISASERDVLYLFRLFDSKGDQRLSYANFLDAVLPATSPALRKLAIERESYYVGRNESLPYDVEWSLSRVFDKEINAYRKAELLKDDLIHRYDFDTLNAFKTIDFDRLGFLDLETLYGFFKRNKIIASDDDVIALLRRIDKDKDGRVSYAEFVDAVLPVDPYYRVTSRSAERGSHRSVERASPTAADRTTLRSAQKSPSRRAVNTSHLSKSVHKPHGFNDIDYYNYLTRSASRSPKKSDSLSKSFVSASKNRPTSPVRESVSKRIAERSPDRLSKSQANWSPSRSRVSGGEGGYRTPPRGASPNRRSASRERLSPLKGNEEEHLAKALKDQIELDKDVENLRNSLALRSDFNLLDAFKIFDVYEKGYIASSEFEDGLREFGVYPSRDEIYLIVRKFDKDSDGRLRYSEFCDIFVPRNGDYAGILTSRVPSYVESRKANLLFGFDTRKTIQKFFNTLFQNESIIEGIRQRLNKRPLFDIYDAFRALDRNDNGFITLDEFKEVLLDHGIYSSSNELLNLIKRFDKNQDGKVSYGEFVNEITPKSPKKY